MRRALVLWFGLACLPVGRAQRAQPDLSQFVVILNEGQTDISPRGINVRSCALVSADGRFHLERRYQQLPEPSANLKVYEYPLDSVQLQRLRAILDDEGVRRLPPFAWPPTPAVGTKFRGFEARIVRGGQVQHVGYFVGSEGTAGNQLDPATAGIKKEWKEATAALQPLFRWLQDLEASKLEPSGRESTLCSTGGDR
jgi:hypothetical protein